MVAARDRAAAEEGVRRLAQTGHRLIASEPEFADIILLGPAEPPLAIVRTRHRARLIVKSPRSVDLQRFVRVMVSDAGAMKGGARLEIDIDPTNFL